MDVQLPKLQTQTLRRAPDPSAYKLYRAAQEWDLVDPILIRDRQDLKSEPKWHDHIEPYYHQIRTWSLSVGAYQLLSWPMTLGWARPLALA